MYPSDFIMSSDFLSIAQVDSETYEANFDGGSLVGENDYVEKVLNFTTRAQQGSVDRILISKDGDPYELASRLQLNPNGQIFGFIEVYRTSRTNLRVQMVLENYDQDTTTYPAMSFKIKISSFKAPNVF